jgi:protoporphyrinogen oxidase
MRVGILGGGLAGLTLANLLRHKVEVLEKNPECGGLCRTLTDEGFTFDYGGCHILFSRDELAVNFILDALRENKARNRRNSKVLYGDRYVKYPFENGLGDLSPQDNFDCLYGFIQAA